jgi:hypothetical protein
LNHAIFFQPVQFDFQPVSFFLVRTQKFSEKGKAPPTLIEKGGFGCFWG